MNIKTVGGVICFLAAFALAFKLTSGRPGGPGRGGSVEDQLTIAVAEINKRLPMQIDPVTRCERAESGPGKTLTYIYTLGQSLSPVEKAALETIVRGQVWSDQKTKALLQSGITFCYRYFDAAGNIVHEFFVTPDGTTSRPASAAPAQPEMLPPPSEPLAPPPAAETGPEPAPAVAASPEYRTWSDSTGKFQVEDQLLAHGEGKVTLKTRDGKEVVVPLARLSPADQAYVAEITVRASSPSASTERAVNLLSLVDPRRDRLKGEWRLEGGSLISPLTQAAMIQVPHALPEEYCLTLVAEPIAGSDGLNIGIIVGGHQTMVSFDGWGIKANGLNLVDGMTANSNETTKIASVFTPGVPTTIVCTVRKSSVEVTANGRPLFQWSGDPGRLSLDERFWSGAAPGRLFFGSWETSYRISRLELVPLGR